MWLQVSWALTLSAFVFLAPAHKKQYLGKISIYDSSEFPGHRHISPFDRKTEKCACCASLWE